MSEEESRALVPIQEMLPELRAEEYADVCAWDAARVRLQEGYELTDGQYLSKIRYALKDKGHGLWTEYLRAREIPESTARTRILKAEGRWVKPSHDDGLRPVRAPAPQFDAVDAIDDAEPLDWAPVEREFQRVAQPAPLFVPSTVESQEELDSFDREQTRLHPHIPSREEIAQPMYAFVQRLTGYRAVSPESIDAWLDVASREELDEAVDTFHRLTDWAGAIAAQAYKRNESGPRMLRRVNE